MLLVRAGTLLCVELLASVVVEEGDDVVEVSFMSGSEDVEDVNSASVVVVDVGASSSVAVGVVVVSAALVDVEASLVSLLSSSLLFCAITGDVNAAAKPRRIDRGRMAAGALFKAERIWRRFRYNPRQVKVEM